MNTVLSFGSDAFVVPSSVLDAHGASELDMLVIIHICADRKTFDTISELSKRLALKLNRQSNDIEASLHFWRGTGILSFSAEFDDNLTKRGSENHTEPEKLQADNTPEKHLQNNDKPIYTGISASKIIDGTPGFKTLIDECQNILGKMFNTTEINSLICLSDHLRLDNEHIMMLVYYCKSKGKTSMRYIEKTAYTLFDEGIDTLPKFEEYIKVREEYKNDLPRLLELFGFGGRAPTKREEDFFNCWFVDWKYDFEIIHRAYDITVESTDGHKLSLPYLNKILQNWHDAGYKSIAEIEAALDSYRRSKEDSAHMRNQQSGNFDTDEFFELALKRSYEKINKQ